MIRVFLVDDHEMVRRGLIDIMRRADDIDVIGEAETVDHALRRIEALRPDVAVLDVRLPDGNGIELCRQIKSKHPETACLILTAYDDDVAATAAVLAGAAGYVLKSVGSRTLLDDIRTVSSGGTILSADTSARVSTRMRTAAEEDPRLRALGLREKQVLALIADGLTNRQIGARLGLAEKTVKNYVSSLLLKLGIESRTQAAIFRLEHDSG